MLFTMILLCALALAPELRAVRAAPQAAPRCPAGEPSGLSTPTMTGRGTIHARRWGGDDGVAYAVPRQEPPKTAEATFSAGDARALEAEQFVRGILARLEKTRSVRWCALKKGLAPLAVRHLEEEKRLIEELAEATAARDGTWGSEISLMAASDLAGAGLFSEALAALGPAGDNDGAGDALFLQSWCLERLDRNAEATKGYEAYARGEGLLADYAILLGSRCLRRQGYVAAAAKTLTRLIEGWQDSPVWAEAAVELCDCHLSLERYEDCAGIAELIASKAPRDLDKRVGLYYLARALEGAGREADAARIYWKLVRDYPSHPKAARAFNALSEIKSKLNRGLTDEELYHGGVALFKSGDYADAHRTLEKLVSRGQARDYWRDGLKEMARVSYARKHYSEASKEYRSLVEAGGPDADEALLWVGKSELRAGRYESAFEVLEALGRGAADPSIRVEALWEAGREKESRGLLAEAAADYGYAAEHLSHTPQGPEACWRLGFCRFLVEDFEGAREAFGLARDVATAPYLRAQCLYWLAKSLWRLGRRGEAEDALRSAAAEGLGVYYGARAAWILDIDIAEIDSQGLLLPRMSRWGDELSASGGVFYTAQDTTVARSAFEKDSTGTGLSSRSRSSSDGDTAASDGVQDTYAALLPAVEVCMDASGYPGLSGVWSGRETPRGSAGWHFARGMRLLCWGEPGRGAREIQAAFKAGGSKEEAIEVLSFSNRHIDAMLIAGSPVPAVESRPEDDYLYASFPLGFADHVWREAMEAGLDPLLAFSMIRQESRFNPEAVSGAGARGLMQLMPSTARKLSRDLGLRWRGKSSLFDPGINTHMGARYFAQMLENHGSLPAALAAYNGGASKAKEWALLAEGKGLDSYVEMIGYRETRTYVKLVIMQYLTYLRLYDRERDRPGPPQTPAARARQDR